MSDDDTATDAEVIPAGEETDDDFVSDPVDPDADDDDNDVDDDG